VKRIAPGRARRRSMRASGDAAGAGGRGPGLLANVVLQGSKNATLRTTFALKAPEEVTKLGSTIPNSATDSDPGAIRGRAAFARMSRG